MCLRMLIILMLTVIINLKALLHLLIPSIRTRDPNWSTNYEMKMYFVDVELQPTGILETSSSVNSFPSINPVTWPVDEPTSPRLP